MKQYNNIISTIIAFLAIQTKVCATTELDWTAGFSSADARAKTVDAGTELIFNWQGRHDVVVVPTKEAFDACDFSEGISLGTASGVKTTVTETSYFVCTVGRHCALGQKLAVTVTSDTMEDVSMMEELDWTEGFRNPEAREKMIDAGTKLIFTWPEIWQGQPVSHDVVVVPTKEAFDACDFSEGVTIGEAPDVEYTVMETTYFVCTVPGHCFGGQKLAAMVTSDAMEDGPMTEMEDESMTDMKDESMNDMKDESMSNMKDESMNNMKDESMNNMKDESMNNMKDESTTSSATTKFYVSLITAAFTAMSIVL